MCGNSELSELWWVKMGPGVTSTQRAVGRMGWYKMAVTPDTTAFSRAGHSPGLLVLCKWEVVLVKF